MRRRQPQAGDQWHLDEAFIKVNGVRQYPRRAVDQDGNVLDVPAQSRRDAKTARRFMTKPMKKQRRVPRVLATDKLRSHSPAHRELMSSVDTSHRRAEQPGGEQPSAHPPAPTRDQALPLTPRSAQKFLTAFSQISPHFRPRRHLLTAPEYCTEMHHRFTTWNRITGTTGSPAAT